MDASPISALLVDASLVQSWLVQSSLVHAWLVDASTFPGLLGAVDSALEATTCSPSGSRSTMSSLKKKNRMLPNVASKGLFRCMLSGGGTQSAEAFEMYQNFIQWLAFALGVVVHPQIQKDKKYS